MSEFKKTGQVAKLLTVDGGELTLINKQSLRPLAAEEVYAFRLLACDSLVDREFEHFSIKALTQLAKLFVGRPVLRDHNWSANAQTARVYAGEVATVGEVTQLVLRAYLLRTALAEDTIAALEGGILREVSVGCAVAKSICSICGTDKGLAWCGHRPGKEYNGKQCTVELHEATDAYEVSLVAVPAQQGAGVVKCYGGEDNRPQPPTQTDDPETTKALALVALEEKRF